MPLHEYHCKPCNHNFEMLIRSADDKAICPRCESTEQLIKQFSVPAAVQSSGARSSSQQLPIAGCGAPACCGGGCSV